MSSSQTPSRSTTPSRPRQSHSRSASVPMASPNSQLPTPTPKRTTSVRNNKRLSRVIGSSSGNSPSTATLTPPGSPHSKNTSPVKKNRDAIKVIARFRPETETEKSQGLKSSLRFIDETSIALANETFTFDRVFGPESTQQELFAYSVEQTVDDLFAGYNGTVLAYGQTGSGKTHTMMGPVLHDEQKGVILRIADAVFDRISKEQKKDQSTDATEYTLSASYMEIYMEQIRDLLNPKNEAPLAIHEDGVNGVHVRNLSKRYVSSSEDVYAVLEKGSQMRAVGSTDMNSESSRSHAIFVMDLTQENITDGVIRSKLFLVDLAGSEKVGKTGASGQTLEEAKKINSSLTHLGIVINALTDAKSMHIPYRDSKLTRILQQSLGGNSRTSLIVNCSPAAYNEQETLSTLRFGTRAKRIKNKAHVNSEPSQLDLLRKIEQLTKMNQENELHSKELEMELELWKTGVKTYEKAPPPPPPKDLPGMSMADLKKMQALEARVEELTAMISRAPVVSEGEDESLVKQLQDSQMMNGELIEDLNNKCIKLFEMQLEIDKLGSQLQTPRVEDEKLFVLEKTLCEFANQVEDLEHQNHNLHREVVMTRKIAETRQERIKTLEELLSDQQKRVQKDSAQFEFKLFSLKERLSIARRLSTASNPSVNGHKHTLSTDTFRLPPANMSKIDEDRSVFGTPLAPDRAVLHTHRRSNSQVVATMSGGSDESLSSIKRSDTRATSFSQRTSSMSSSNSGGGIRFGLSLNVVKPNSHLVHGE